MAKVRITSKISGSEIIVDGAIVGRLESFRTGVGMTYVQLIDGNGTWLVARFKYRGHRARAVAFTKQLLATKTSQQVIVIAVKTGKSGNELLDAVNSLAGFASEEARTAWLAGAHGCSDRGISGFPK